MLIHFPTALVLLEGVENLLRRCKFRNVYIVDSGNFSEKESEIILLREASKLRGVIEAHIDNSLDARVAQRREKTIRGGLREADCENPDAHVIASLFVGEISNSV